MTAREYRRFTAGSMGTCVLLLAGCSADTSNGSQVAIEGELEVYVVSDSAERIHDLREESGRRGQWTVLTHHCDACI